MAFVHAGDAPVHLVQQTSDSWSKAKDFKLEPTANSQTCFPIPEASILLNYLNHLTSRDLAPCLPDFLRRMSAAGLSAIDDALLEVLANGNCEISFKAPIYEFLIQLLRHRPDAASLLRKEIVRLAVADMVEAETRHCAHVKVSTLLYHLVDLYGDLVLQELVLVLHSDMGCSLSPPVLHYFSTIIGHPSISSDDIDALLLDIALRLEDVQVKDTQIKLCDLLTTCLTVLPTKTKRCPRPSSQLLSTRKMLLECLKRAREEGTAAAPYILKVLNKMEPFMRGEVHYSAASDASCSPVSKELPLLLYRFSIIISHPSISSHNLDTLLLDIAFTLEDVKDTDTQKKLCDLLTKCLTVIPIETRRRLHPSSQFLSTRKTLRLCLKRAQEEGTAAAPYFLKVLNIMELLMQGEVDDPAASDASCPPDSEELSLPPPKVLINATAQSAVKDGSWEQLFYSMMVLLQSSIPDSKWRALTFIVHLLAATDFPAVKHNLLWSQFIKMLQEEDTKILSLVLTCMEQMISQCPKEASTVMDDLLKSLVILNTPRNQKIIVQIMRLILTTISAFSWKRNMDSFSAVLKISQKFMNSADVEEQCYAVRLLGEVAKKSRGWPQSSLPDALKNILLMVLLKIHTKDESVSSAAEKVAWQFLPQPNRLRRVIRSLFPCFQPRETEGSPKGRIRRLYKRLQKEKLLRLLLMSTIHNLDNIDEIDGLERHLTLITDILPQSKLRLQDLDAMRLDLNRAVHSTNPDTTTRAKAAAEIVGQKWNCLQRLGPALTDPSVEPALPDLSIEFTLPGATI